MFESALCWFMFRLYTHTKYMVKQNTQKPKAYNDAHNLIHTKAKFLKRDLYTYKGEKICCEYASNPSHGCQQEVINHGLSCPPKPCFTTKCFTTVQVSIWLVTYVLTSARRQIQIKVSNDHTPTVHQVMLTKGLKVKVEISLQAKGNIRGLWALFKAP